MSCSLLHSNADDLDTALQAGLADSRAVQQHMSHRLSAKPQPASVLLVLGPLADMLLPLQAAVQSSTVFSFMQCRKASGAA